MEHYDNEYEFKADFQFFLTIAILVVSAILLKNAIHTHFRLRGSGRYTQCQSNLRSIGTALELYSCDIGELYPASLSQLTPKYLKTIPICAAGGVKNGGYETTYRVSSNRRAYSFFCVGVNHPDVGVGRNYPQYNSYSGLTPK